MRSGIRSHGGSDAEHSSARAVFMDSVMSRPTDEWVALIKKYDREDPGFYVEWYRELKRSRRESLPPPVP